MDIDCMNLKNLYLVKKIVINYWITKTYILLHT